jgi:hypothetical protein
MRRETSGFFRTKKPDILGVIIEADLLLLVPNLSMKVRERTINQRHTKGARLVKIGKRLTGESPAHGVFTNRGTAIAARYALERVEDGIRKSRVLLRIRLGIMTFSPGESLL